MLVQACKIIRGLNHHSFGFLRVTGYSKKISRWSFARKINWSLILFCNSSKLLRASIFKDISTYKLMSPWKLLIYSVKFFGSLTQPTFTCSKSTSETTTIFAKSLKLSIKTTQSDIIDVILGVCIVSFEHIFLVFPLLTLNK